MSCPPPSESHPPSCPGVFIDFSTPCNRRPDSQCLYRSCQACCISRGGQSFLGCQDPNHRVYTNPAQSFEPNWWYPERTESRPYLLPITSPLNGGLQQKAGSAFRDLVSTDGWEELQRQLRKDAIERYEAGEGITVFVFIWPEVSDLILLPATQIFFSLTLSFPQGDHEPALFMRVIGRGRSWSLMGDYALQQQLKRDGLSHNVHEYLSVYRSESEEWVRQHSAVRVKVTGVGASIFVKAVGIEHPPLFPLILRRMFSAVRI